MTCNVAVVNLGKIAYNASQKLQNRLATAIKQKSFVGELRPENIMLLMEYPPLYTIGIRTRGYTQQDEAKLRETGAEFYRTDRGGLITFHGPGQLVVYPILDLKCWSRVHGVRWYVNSLEATVIELCNEYNIKAHRYHPYPGIWVGERKLCAIGVHVSRHVTTHGVAINCDTELEWFEHIVPCGIQGKGVTSISELLHNKVTITDVVPLFLNVFKTVFHCDIYQLSPKDLHESLPIEA